MLRPKDPAKADRIARCMEMACANQHIGYDQGGRDTLFTAAGAWGYDVSKVAKDVETDCSALVRVCCAYAGITVPSFRTTDEAAKLLATGEFIQFTDSKHVNSSNRSRRGDILVTRKQGHTVVVLSNGPGGAPLGARTLGSRHERRRCGRDASRADQARLRPRQMGRGRRLRQSDRDYRQDLPGARWAARGRHNGRGRHRGAAGAS